MKGVASYSSAGVKLVASGLRPVAAFCSVLQSCREKAFNLLRVSTCGRELLICGLWVRFPPGSPEIPFVF
jgi:hypothetical protein